MVRARAWIWPACALVAVSVLGDCAHDHGSSAGPTTTTTGTTAYVSSGYACTCHCCDGTVENSVDECNCFVCSDKGGTLGSSCECGDITDTCAACESCAECQQEWSAMTEHPRYEQIQRCVDACVGSCGTSCIEQCMAGDARTMVTWRDYYRCIGCDWGMCGTRCYDDDYIGPLIDWACGEGSSSCDGGAGGVAGAGVGGRGGAGG